MIITDFSISQIIVYAIFIKKYCVVKLSRSNFNLSLFMDLNYLINFQLLYYFFLFRILKFIRGEKIIFIGTKKEEGQIFISTLFKIRIIKISLDLPYSSNWFLVCLKLLYIVHIGLPIFNKAVMISSYHPVVIMRPYHRSH